MITRMATEQILTALTALQTLVDSSLTTINANMATMKTDITATLALMQTDINAVRRKVMDVEDRMGAQDTNFAELKVQINQSSVTVVGQIDSKLKEVFTPMSEGIDEKFLQSISTTTAISERINDVNEVIISLNTNLNSIRDSCAELESHVVTNISKIDVMNDTVTSFVASSSRVRSDSMSSVASSTVSSATIPSKSLEIRALEQAQIIYASVAATPALAAPTTDSLNFKLDSVLPKNARFGPTSGCEPITEANCTSFKVNVIFPLLAAIAAIADPDTQRRIGHNQARLSHFMTAEQWEYCTSEIGFLLGKSSDKVTSLEFLDYIFQRSEDTILNTTLLYQEIEAIVLPKAVTETDVLSSYFTVMFTVDKLIKKYNAGDAYDFSNKKRLENCKEITNLVIKKFPANVLKDVGTAQVRDERLTWNLPELMRVVVPIARNYFHYGSVPPPAQHKGYPPRNGAPNNNNGGNKGNGKPAPEKPPPTTAPVVPTQPPAIKRVDFSVKTGKNGKRN